jgi:hypothetical protein
MVLPCEAEEYDGLIHVPVSNEDLGTYWGGNGVYRTDFGVNAQFSMVSEMIECP